MENVASRYGLALYSLALEEKKIDSWQEEVKTLKSIFEENTDFIMILGSSFISLEERIEILEKTLKGVDKNIVALIDVVMENNRIDLIFDVFDSFNSYCNQYRGVSEGLIYSTLRLEQSVIDQIEEKISKIEQNKVELKNVVDPSLIGGIKIVIKDHIYDGSIKHSIEMMKKDLLK
ncbi:MAG: ATP synthase F1 subunit delta [Bacilli bacterium]|nr:ATP synthase F1 subunit delta [Bacilli bacterium]